MPAHRAQGGLSLSGGKLASSDLQRAKELFKELLSKSFVFPFIPYYFVLIFSLLSQVQTALRLLSGVTSEWAERNEKIWWQKIPLPLMKWQNKASKFSWCILNSTQMCIKAHVEDAKKTQKIDIYSISLYMPMPRDQLLQTSTNIASPATHCEVFWAVVGEMLLARCRPQAVYIRKQEGAVGV